MWRDLVGEKPEELVFPWLGDRNIVATGTACHNWFVEGRMPDELGWHRFVVQPTRKSGGDGGRRIVWKAKADPVPTLLQFYVRGYLVGDRFVEDSGSLGPLLPEAPQLERVYLVDDGLDRFSRIMAGRLHRSGQLIYIEPAMPMGPEQQVLDAYLDRATSTASIAGVSPALDAAFRFETWARAEAERRRAELERQRREEEERLAKEQRRRQIAEQLGDAVGRRQMARLDFGEAAKAALAVGGATYLDHRKGARRGEMVVRYRLMNRRFECVCDEATLRLTDSGICLTAHGDDEFEAGTKGDTWLTLESLPSVVREADREGRLVIFRHVDQ